MKPKLKLYCGSGECLRTTALHQHELIMKGIYAAITCSVTIRRALINVILKLVTIFHVI